ncbi:hypothetical protein K438DRAFT_1646879 [Mycena galopus ATCC 62051]|nr:hypothetical protein K438DRAFT_1646879 [Mycena galopus ATCC 62051]
MSQPAIKYKLVGFEVKIASYQDLTAFSPVLPTDWYYLGPVATSEGKSEQSGMIVRAVDDGALADVVDWKKVGPNNGSEPPPPFSTWRGIAPDGYVVVGDFFVEGNEKPSPQQTAGIKAIRRDLVGLLPPQRLIWTGRQPWSVVTLWDIVATPLIYIPTGAFGSNADSTAEGIGLALLLFSVTKSSAWYVIRIYKT